MGDPRTKSTERLDDLVDSRFPDEWLWISVMDVDVLADGRLEFTVAAVRSTSNLFLDDQADEALDEVHPGSTSRSEVEMESRSFGEPVPGQRCLVRAVVVEDEVDVELLGNRVCGPVEGIRELDRAVPAAQRTDDPPGNHLEGRGRRRRPVPRVVMRAPLDLAWRHREHRLRAVERPGSASVRRRTAPSGTRAGPCRGRRCPAASRQKAGRWRV